MSQFFDINTIFFDWLGYKMSYLEFFGTITGAVAVWLSARANVWSWPIGIVSVALLFFLFYQVQLYPDMFLQVFFLITNLIGWWRWLHPKRDEEDRKHELRVSYLKRSHLFLTIGASLAGTFLLGLFAENLHTLFPTLFTLPSAFPYADSFITVMSIAATFLMIDKKVECWILWIIIDVLATYLYFVKDIRFLAFEYLVFCFMAAYGVWNWAREFSSYQNTSE